MNPPLLLNENFPAPAVRRRRAAGLDVLDIAGASPGMDDVDVLG